jgi:hypothetical protein
MVANTSLGIYGFSRGYRAKRDCNYNKLTSEKFLSGCVNGVFYMLPPLNIICVIKILNRMEIENKNLDKDMHKNEYEEYIGGYVM